MIQCAARRRDFRTFWVLTSLIFLLPKVAISEEPDVKFETLKVQVVDGKDQPISRATVRITHFGMSSGSLNWNDKIYGKRKSVTTDKNGIANVRYPALVDEDRVTLGIGLDIRHSKYCAVREFVNILNRQEFFAEKSLPRKRSTKITLQLGTVITLKVQRESGESLKQHCVALVQDDSAYGLPFTTNEQGLLVSRPLPKNANLIRVAYVPLKGPAMFSDPIFWSPEKKETHSQTITVRPRTANSRQARCQRSAACEEWGGYGCRKQSFGGFF